MEVMTMLVRVIMGFGFVIMGFCVIDGILVSDKMGYDAMQICGIMLMCTGAILVGFADRE
jgi:hypothetical protein